VCIFPLVDRKSRGSWHCSTKPSKFCCLCNLVGEKREENKLALTENQTSKTRRSLSVKALGHLKSGGDLLRRKMKQDAMPETEESTLILSTMRTYLDELLESHILPVQSAYGVRNHRTGRRSSIACDGMNAMQNQDAGPGQRRNSLDHSRVSKGAYCENVARKDSVAEARRWSSNVLRKRQQHQVTIEIVPDTAKLPASSYKIQRLTSRRPLLTRWDSGISNPSLGSSDHMPAKPRRAVEIDDDDSDDSSLSSASVTDGAYREPTEHASRRGSFCVTMRRRSNESASVGSADLPPGRPAQRPRSPSPSAGPQHEDFAAATKINNSVENKEAFPRLSGRRNACMRQDSLILLRRHRPASIPELSTPDGEEHQPATSASNHVSNADASIV
jgi:hypothetical protein